MEFLLWHYSSGIRLYLDRWRYAIGWVANYFSLTILPLSLFAPWKRLVDDFSSPGFNFARALEQFSFNLISRGVGAVVRSIIFLVGLMALGLVLTAGPLGLVFWLLFPLASYPSYSRRNFRLDLQIARLVESANKSGNRLLSTVFTHPAGQFVLVHNNLQSSDLDSVPVPPGFTLPPSSSFSGVLDSLISANIWSSEHLRRLGCSAEDLAVAASWWDSLQWRDTPGPAGYGQPGIGAELLFGFTPTLDQFAVDLATPTFFSRHLIVGRDDQVNRMEQALLSGKSVVLTGLPGVGKRTTALKFAYRAREGLLNPKLAYRRILELNYNFLLSETLDINSKKSRLQQILSEAAGAGNIILFIKDLHRLVNPSVEGLDFTDVFESFLSERDLKIISVVVAADYERYLAANIRLRKFFETIEVVQPGLKDALQIAVSQAGYWEQTKNIVISVPALRRIIEGSDQLITEIPFPEKALDILDELVIYAQRHKIAVVTPVHVNTLLAQKTGINLSVLTSGDKHTLANLESIIHKYLVGQDESVKLISKSLRARSLGVKNQNRPIGSFLFLGPTGVGKTQTAKALAQAYFGSSARIVRFDMAEYAGYDGLSRLIGSSTQDTPGSLTTAIKNHPQCLLLLDEIEKSPPQVYNLLLSLLDEGFITDAAGRKILGRHLFVIATSNAGSEYVRQLVSQGITGEKLQRQVLDYVQKIGTFSPEFLNRFDGVIVYPPLTRDQLVSVSRLMLEDLAKSLKEQGITLQITDEICETLASEGYEPASGARPMRRLVDLELGDIVAKALLRGDIAEGDTIRILPGPAPRDFDVVKV